MSFCRLACKVLLCWIKLLFDPICFSKSFIEVKSVFCDKIDLFIFLFKLKRPESKVEILLLIPKVSLRDSTKIED